MTQENKELLLKDLCGRLPYGVYIEHTPTKIRGKLNNINVVHRYNGTNSVQEVEATIFFLGEDCYIDVIYFKPYLRPMNSMTEEEAKEISILYGLKDILSIKIKDEYIEVVVDDGICSTEVRTIWYDEMMSSIEIFDFLNAHHFDYRDLIPKGLAIKVTKENNPY